MKILSINSGSSSLKFCFFEMDNESIIASGSIERIGIEGSSCKIKYQGDTICEDLEIENHDQAVQSLLDHFLSLEIVSSYEDIQAVGHRILHGKDVFSESVLITSSVMKELEKLVDLGPLHMKANLAGIKAFQEVLPNVVQVAVFDTAFHQTMEEDSYLYPVPYQWYEQYGVRKYGFHGISHQYIAEAVKKLLGRDHFKLISCHIGNGGSVTAIRDMKVVDTSMGFTPLAGVMMGTRSGDVDPSIIPYVMEKEGKNASEVVDDLNRISGVLGLSGYSSDMRDLIEKCEEGSPKAILAKNKYVRRVVDYIAQYYVLLEGVDVIVFTAGVGENNIPIRREICEKLSCLGVKIDLDSNNICGDFVQLNTLDSAIDVYVIPTNEELMIARDTLKFVNR